MGGCGFVGSNLAIDFKKKYPDYNITAFDNLQRRGAELNLQRLKNVGVIYYHGDIRNFEDLTPFDKVDIMEFNRCVAAMAIMAYVVADMDDRLPR